MSVDINCWSILYVSKVNLDYLFHTFEIINGKFRINRYLSLTNLSKMLFKWKSTSSRRVNFNGQYTLNHQGFNSIECMSLIHSLLCQECWVLWIKFEKRMNIIHIIKMVSSRWMLIFRCKDDIYNVKALSSTDDDEFLQWLPNYLPLSYSFIRHKHEWSTVLILISYK